MTAHLHDIRKNVAALGTVTPIPAVIGGGGEVEITHGVILRTQRERELEAERDELRRVVEWPNTHAVHYLVNAERWWAADDACFYYEGATFEEAVRRAIASTDAPPDLEAE